MIGGFSQRNSNVEELVLEEVENLVLCILIYLLYLWFSDSFVCGILNCFKCKFEKQIGSFCFLLFEILLI